MVKKAVGLPAPLMLGSKDEIIDDDDMDAEPQWTLKYLYDGGCTVCMSLVGSQ